MEDPVRHAYHRFRSRVARWRDVTLGDNGTDGQTDGQTDRV